MPLITISVIYHVLNIGNVNNDFISSCDIGYMIEKIGPQLLVFTYAKYQESSIFQNQDFNHLRIT